MKQFSSIVGMIMLGAFAVAAPGNRPDKIEVQYSMEGYRDTLVFYIFDDLPAVLVVRIDNKNETFPLIGFAYLFEQGTTEEGLRKWINNQHSDGLHPEVPKPVLKKQLPPSFCTITARKKTGTSANPGNEAEIYKDFEVTLSIKPQDIDGKAKLPGFNDTVKVFVKP